MKRTREAYIYAERNEWADKGSDNEYNIHISDLDFTNTAGLEKYIMIAKHELMFDMPDRATMVRAEVQGLRAMRTRILAESQKAAVEIDGKIENLLALTHEVPR